jgi:hypothetical protein
MQRSIHRYSPVVRRKQGVFGANLPPGIRPLYERIFAHWQRVSIARASRPMRHGSVVLNLGLGPMQFS